MLECSSLVHGAGLGNSPAKPEMSLGCNAAACNGSGGHGAHASAGVCQPGPRCPSSGRSDAGLCRGQRRGIPPAGKSSAAPFSSVYTVLFEDKARGENT